MQPEDEQTPESPDEDASGDDEETPVEPEATDDDHDEDHDPLDEDHDPLDDEDHDDERDEFDDYEDRRRRRRRDLSDPEEPLREGFWDRAIGKRLGLVPDMVKRTLVGSLGSMFMSEDGLRQQLTELRLPKEIVTFIVQQADNTKREFMRLVARELRDFLESTNFYDELRKILTSLSFEIRTEVRLIPNDNAFVKPDITNTVKVKRDGRDVPMDEESEPPEEET